MRSPYATTVTCAKMTAELAEHAAALFARRWIDWKWEESA
jgi:hypothetical protein